MPNAESTVGRRCWSCTAANTSHAIAPGYGVVTIGREVPGRSCRSMIRESPGRICERYPTTDSGAGIVDNSPSGMFVDGLRESSVTVSDKTTVRFGDPTGGKALTFEVVRPSNSPEEHGREQRVIGPIGRPDREDPGVVRAGAAAAARRRELDISQRSLAADGIINAGALIAFEKGRSWPRERTRAKLEEVLQWPAGTIARIREGPHGGRHESPAIKRPRAGARCNPGCDAGCRRPGVVDRAGGGRGRGHLQPGHRRVAATGGSRVHRAGGADPRRFAPARGDCRPSNPHQSDYPGTDQGDGRGAPLPRQIDDARRDSPRGHAGAAFICRAPAREPFHSGNCTSGRGDRRNDRPRRSRRSIAGRRPPRRSKLS